MKRKTHEEYVVELSKKNPNLEVLEEYINAQTKIMHRCLTHDIKWKLLPGNALSGKGCKECMKDKKRKNFAKSHENYISQLKEVNPDIVVLENYLDARTPILHLCKKHNIQWMACPSNILKGQGCVECGKDKYHNKRCKKHEDYVHELAIKNPTIEIAGKYIDSHTSVLHRCLIHDVYCDLQPVNALRGDGCEICHSERIGLSNGRIHEEYIKELAIKNPNIEVVGHYIGHQIKILHHCLIHDKYWETMPSNVLKGCGCPECLREKISQSNILTNEKYIQMLQERNSTVIALEEYLDMKTQIWHKCTKHNYKWKTTPASVLQGCGCPKCKSEKISEKLSKTHEEYVEELRIVNPDIVVVENYIDANTPILHMCLLDNNKWYATPANILFGTGCPRCNESRGERTIRQWLEANQIEYIFQKGFEDCKDIKILPFDFYLPEYNLCIEYDGIQHFEPIEHFGGKDSFKVTVKHDEIKNNYCKDNGILLLRIPYFKNAEEELNNFLFI